MAASPPITAADAQPLTTAGRTALFDRLDGSELARLTLGLYFVFWSALVVLVALCELLTGLAMRFMPAIVLAAGGVGLVFGAWRLHQVKGLGDSWRRRTREGLIAAALLAYLCPFFLMWRQLPTNLYLLGHALGLLAVFFYSLTLHCQTVAVLGRAAGKRSLVIQAILFGTSSVVMLFPPFALFAKLMVVAARDGRDPLGLLQFWLERAHPWVVLVLLVPFALTLSLVWGAKDLVLHRLFGAPADDSTPS